MSKPADSLHVVARIEVLANPPRMTDFEDEPTQPNARPERHERPERPTIPLFFHGLSLDRLEQLIAKRRG